MTQPIPFKDLIESFGSGRCLLVLGPDVPRSVITGPSQESLLDFIHRENPALSIDRDLEGLYKCDDRVKVKAYGLIKAYYEEQKPNELLKQLALIPFSLIISVTPDLLLKRAFDEQGIACDLAYYEPKKMPQEFSKPTVDRPLIYNLFGSIESRTSLILTHQDLIAFLFSVIKDFELPRQLRESIRDATGFIFLGFHFDKWYVKLMLELFDLEDKVINAAEAPNATAVELRSFYNNHYFIDFVDADVSAYMQTLYEYCQQKGSLRKRKPTASKSDQIREMIRKDELRPAMELLQEILDNEGNTELLNDAMNIEGRLSTLEKKSRRQIITDEEFHVERNKIREAVLSISDDLRARPS